jgi:hypothetical protein
MTKLGSSLQGALLNRAWIQWTALGVEATAERDEAVVDPEALIALTAELADADARLRDLSIDWCVAYGRYVNGSRLKQVVGELGTPAPLIGTLVATVAEAGGPAWPMATAARTDYQRRNKARMETAVPPARLRIRLRAAFGVNARADILATLLAASPHELSTADLARAARFTKANIASAVDALVLSGLVTERWAGNERRLSLQPNVPILAGLVPPVAQPDWVTRFGICLAVWRFESREFGSSLVRAVDGRRLVDELLPRLLADGAPLPSLNEPAEAFERALDRWIVSLVDWLRQPSQS